MIKILFICHGNIRTQALEFVFPKFSTPYRNDDSTYSLSKCTDGNKGNIKLDLKFNGIKISFQESKNFQNIFIIEADFNLFRAE